MFLFYNIFNTSCFDLKQEQDETYICPRTFNDHKC